MYDFGMFAAIISIFNVVIFIPSHTTAKLTHQQVTNFGSFPSFRIWFKISTFKLKCFPAKNFVKYMNKRKSDGAKSDEWDQCSNNLYLMFQQFVLNLIIILPKYISGLGHCYDGRWSFFAIWVWSHVTLAMTFPKDAINFTSFCCRASDFLLLLGLHHSFLVTNTRIK